MKKTCLLSLIIGVSCLTSFAQDQVLDGSLQLGLNGGSVTGYGKRLTFSGLDQGTDEMWISRFNREFNISDIRVNIGDDYGTGDDRFVIGTLYWSDGIYHPHMVVGADGKVGIGTETFGDERLAVAGKIRSKEVLVETSNWPDYVFKPDYRLPNLSALKTYINQNQHLPDIPSAAEVEKKGINLGELNAKLLKKIEELTLHLIEKDEELKCQEQRLVTQDKRIQAIENRLISVSKKDN